MLVRAGLFGFVALAAIVTLPGVAAAQSFDCSKARSPQEKAICAQPSLGALDRALAEAFAAASARAGEGAAALRTEETAWVRDRDARCNVPARMTACLSAAMTARIAALAPAPVAAAAPLPAPPAPVPAVTPPVGVPSAFNPAPARATLDLTSLPAAAPGDTLLHVQSAGRFALAAHSATGAALQLVDMMSGPAAVAGEPGVRDGRTDVLLDIGTYKLRVIPAEHATGDVQLAVTPFADSGAPVATPAQGDMATGSLGDVQQTAFWTEVGPDGWVEVDAAGRALADLRLWRGGTDLEPLEPASRVVEAVKGHPMLRLRLSGQVEPGTYLVVAYGGPALGWADGDAAMPFLLRAGASPGLRDGWVSGTVGPMGSELFEAPPRAGLFRLDLPGPAAAATLAGGRAECGHRSPATAGTRRRRSARPPTGGWWRCPAWRARRSSFARSEASTAARALGKPGRYWVSAAVRGAGGDEVPPTLLLAVR